VVYLREGSEKWNLRTKVIYSSELCKRTVHFICNYAD